MDVLTTKVSWEQFRSNLLDLKNKFEIDLPRDTPVLYCETCSMNIPLSSNGIIVLEGELKIPLSDIINLELEKIMKNHEKLGCIGIAFHPLIGVPDNLLISFPASHAHFINDVKVNDVVFTQKLVIQEECNQKQIFALFQKKGGIDSTFYDMIYSNFVCFLDADDTIQDDGIEEELVIDDDTAIEHQHALKRMFGGGRKISAPFNYECLWCQTDFIENGLGGRFLLLKNYRDHFRKKHLSDQVKMSEFIERVNRNDPTWFCTNCKRRVGVANVFRHKAACQSNDSNESTKKQRNIETESNNDNSSSEDDNFEPHRSFPPRKLDSSSEEEEASQKDPNKNVLQSSSGKTIRQIKKKTKLDETNQAQFHEPLDEVYISSPEGSPLTEDVEVKVELKEEPCDDMKDGGKSTFDNSLDKNKWWLKLPFEDYFAAEKGGPKIYKADDTEDFVTNTNSIWKKHIQTKRELDQRMIEAESDDEKLNKFSLSRDSPFLDKYTEFVKSFSAKDVLNIFSDEYLSMEIPKGAMSSTATQYGYRIIEFFKFMATKYKEFHFDWMIDFKGSIDKTYPDGCLTKDIFLPTMDDLREFIKSFKYGINPAANCGLRIFALKKMLDFIVQEVKDHEHVFEGSLKEKSDTVDSLVQKLKRLNEGICPDGTIKHLATASNKNHKRSLVEQLAKCPARNMDSIMKGVSEYVQSEEYNIQRTKLIESGCKRTKMPTPQEYMNSTNWLLEQLVCLGGNRPCALLGITLRDWAERKPGYCPFSTEDEKDTIQDDPTNDSRKVLRNPYKKPKGEKSEKPTGFIVNSETDKIAVSANQPCYIWFPNAIADLINDHSLIAQKIMPKSVDIYHPKTRLFLNSKGKPITRIECKHFKKYIGLPITSYDFRRSLSTFCLDSNIDEIRNAESSVLRHREETGYSYYFQKHGEKVEYVSIQYAQTHGLIKASVQQVDEYCSSLRKEAMNQGWDLTQKRTDRAIEYQQIILEMRKKGLQSARQKGERNWILPNELDDFLGGINEAIRIERHRAIDGKPGPFKNLIKYVPGEKNAGIFPPTKIWEVDMFRVLYGLRGEKGDAMRKAELSVYDGVPFSTGLNGRKKIVNELADSEKKRGPMNQTEEWVVANYWREKIRRQTLKMHSGKWAKLNFIFNKDEFNYHMKMTASESDS
jgi:hypothetical protein